MPLVRLEVRNAFGFGGGQSSEHSAEDPKAILDGLAVSGLVGLLRQLGDLADFAAEVFHGLQEQVISTSCRSHSLSARVHRVEAALPPLERVVLAQTTHIHFAYTPGCEWHPRIGNQNYDFTATDLPPFIMDSYEECRPPPRFHLLDRFDTAGPGSCFKRYSDPTLFRRASPAHSAAFKKKRSSKRGGASIPSFVPPIAENLTIHSQPKDSPHGDEPQVSNPADETLYNGNGSHSPVVNPMEFLHEIESEPDNYMDALNTIDSESEYDRGLELFSIRDDPPPPPFESPSHSLLSPNKPEIPDQALSETCGFEQILPDNHLSNPCSSETPTFEKVSNIDTDFSEAIPTTSSQSENVQESSPIDLSTNNSVRIWTNGGLLGLMPSKPPDFSMASPVSRDSVNGGRPVNVGPLVSTYQSDSHLQNGITETGPDNDETSSRVFGLSRRLLSNGFGTKGSDLDDAKSKPTTSHLVPETFFEEQFGYGSAAILSPTASPPLEHMKISFLPLDGSEASKLKLKFSEGKQSHERIRDMFPSFQLIPDASIRPRDYISDSDDDTFCRSSPFMSDDGQSRHSESNSEQWECGEANEDHEKGIYDDILSMNVLELDGMPKRPNSGTHVESSIQSPALDLPSFDAVKPVVHQEVNDESGDVGDSSPLPPPLPPMQWRASKPTSEVVEDTPIVATEAFKQELGQKLTMAPQVIQRTNSDPTIRPKVEKEDEQRSNRQRESDNSSNGKGTDDFLQQIRSKSFSLRRTVTEKPIVASGPTANVNVTAILEKANAIRQAVGSDDGEDDTWSDT